MDCLFDETYNNLIKEKEEFIKEYYENKNNTIKNDEHCEYDGDVFTNFKCKYCDLITKMGTVRNKKLYVTVGIKKDKVYDIVEFRCNFENNLLISLALDGILKNNSFEIMAFYTCNGKGTIVREELHSFPEIIQELKKDDIISIFEQIKNIFSTLVDYRFNYLNDEIMLKKVSGKYYVVLTKFDNSNIVYRKINIKPKDEKMSFKKSYHDKSIDINEDYYRIDFDIEMLKTCRNIIPYSINEYIIYAKLLSYKEIFDVISNSYIWDLLWFEDDKENIQYKSNFSDTLNFVKLKY